MVRRKIGTEYGVWLAYEEIERRKILSILFADLARAAIMYHIWIDRDAHEFDLFSLNLIWLGLWFVTFDAVFWLKGVKNSMWTDTFVVCGRFLVLCLMC